MLQNTLADLGQVHALLDAARLPGLPELLESRDIPARCLFQGKAADELRDVAPYLAQTDPVGPLLPHLLDDTDMPWAMWQKSPGILIVSDIDLASLTQHFRRFLRVQTDRGPNFFRFWEPVAAQAYFTALEGNDDMQDRWFFPRGGGRITALLVPDVYADEFTAFHSADAPAGPTPLARPFSLGAPEIAALRAARMQEDLTAMLVLMIRTFPERAAQMDQTQLDKAIRRSVARMAEFGIRQRDNVFRIAAWDLHSDGPFENSDKSGRLRQILETNNPEGNKMRDLSQRLAQLETTSTET